MAETRRDRTRRSWWLLIALAVIAAAAAIWWTATRESADIGGTIAMHRAEEPVPAETP